jgi:hypothetical protein
METMSDDGSSMISIDGNDNLPYRPPPSRPPVDMLFNHKKVSADAISMSGGSASPSTTESDDQDVPMPVPTPHRPRMPAAYGSGEEEDGTIHHTSFASSERQRLQQEHEEKREILYQLDRLQQRGFKIPRNFSMQSNIEEMRNEFHRLLREKEVDASVRFQRKMMMAFVTGIEFLNTRFDPFDLQLDGWSEQVHESIQDYDDVFEELHEKYKSTGRKMAPELRLLMGLSGSAFMFHLTQSMFKQSQLPGVEQVLRSDPALMRQFQTAAAQQMAGGRATSAPTSANPSSAMPAPPGGGMMNLLSGFFGMGGAAAAPAPSARAAGPQPKMAGPSVDSLLDDIHNEIATSKVPPAKTGGAAAAAATAATQRMVAVEQMSSISDDDINSIIQETASQMGLQSNVGSTVSRGGGAGRGRPRARAAGRGGGGAITRTLQL